MPVLFAMFISGAGFANIRVWSGLGICVAFVSYTIDLVYILLLAFW